MCTFNYFHTYVLFPLIPLLFPSPFLLSLPSIFPFLFPSLPPFSIPPSLFLNYFLLFINSLSSLSSVFSSTLFINFTTNLLFHTLSVLPYQPNPHPHPSPRNLYHIYIRTITICLAIREKNTVASYVEIKQLKHGHQQSI